jgi:hypothetical protein
MIEVFLYDVNILKFFRINENIMNNKNIIPAGTLIRILCDCGTLKNKEIILLLNDITITNFHYFKKGSMLLYSGILDNEIVLLKEEFEIL